MSDIDNNKCTYTLISLQTPYSLIVIDWNNTFQFTFAISVFGGNEMPLLYMNICFQSC